MIIIINKMARQTKQKQLLDLAIKKQKGFFRVEDIHALVPSVGIATVYRRLNALVESGSLYSFMCGASQVFSVSESMHAHFRCEKCSCVVHFNPRFDIKNLPGKAHQVQLDVTGVCSRCS